MLDLGLSGLFWAGSYWFMRIAEFSEILQAGWLAINLISTISYTVCAAVVEYYRLGDL